MVRNYSICSWLDTKLQSFKRRVNLAPPLQNGFSIICVYNDKEKLDKYLLKSLNNQIYRDFELIAIDNRENQFASAGDVLNKVAKRTKYKHLVFVHQDIELSSETWLADAQKTLEKLELYGAAGVAGRSANGLVAMVTHGNPPQFVGPEKLTGAVEVQTLDGCLLMVSRNVFLGTGFDSKTCPGWYLYVANYCLDIARRGYKVFVLPHEVYHESTGPSNHAVFEETRRNIMRKHQDFVDKVYTTVGEWATRERDPASPSDTSEGSS